MPSPLWSTRFREAGPRQQTSRWAPRLGERRGKNHPRKSAWTTAALCGTEHGTGHETCSGHPIGSDAVGGGPHARVRSQRPMARQVPALTTLRRISASQTASALAFAQPPLRYGRASERLNMRTFPAGATGAVGQHAHSSWRTGLATVLRVASAERSVSSCAFGAQPALVPARKTALRLCGHQRASCSWRAARRRPFT